MFWMELLKQKDMAKGSFIAEKALGKLIENGEHWI